MEDTRKYTLCRFYAAAGFAAAFFVHIKIPILGMHKLYDKAEEVLV